MTIRREVSTHLCSTVLIMAAVVTGSYPSNGHHRRSDVNLSRSINGQLSLLLTANKRRLSFGSSIKFSFQYASAYRRQDCKISDGNGKPLDVMRFSFDVNLR